MRVIPAQRAYSLVQRISERKYDTWRSNILDMEQAVARAVYPLMDKDVQIEPIPTRAAMRRKKTKELPVEIERAFINRFVRKSG